MGPSDTGSALAAAQAEFPDWDIYETWDGYLAVPKGTKLIQGMFLDVVTGKLRSQETQ